MTAILSAVFAVIAVVFAVVARYKSYTKPEHKASMTLFKIFLIASIVCVSAHSIAIEPYLCSELHGWWVIFQPGRG